MPVLYETDRITLYWFHFVGHQSCVRRIYDFKQLEFGSFCSHSHKHKMTLFICLFVELSHSRSRCHLPFVFYLFFNFFFLTFTHRCSHSDLVRISNGIKAAAKLIDRPIDEVILENNQLPSLPSKFFSPLRIVRLMLRNNGVERLATGWISDLELHLVEIFIVERALRSLPFDSLIECKKLQAVTIQSNLLKRAPSFSGLYNLQYIKIEGIKCVNFVYAVRPM